MPRPARTWTIAEAEAALPEVRRMLRDVRGARSDVLDAELQLKDLLLVHGARVRSAGEGHDEWQEHIRLRTQAHRRLHEALDAFRRQGIEVKDVDTGLIDFWAEKGKELVFLCWKEGESRIQAWHDIDSGYAGRQPVPTDLLGV